MICSAVSFHMLCETFIPGFWCDVYSLFLLMLSMIMIIFVSDFCPTQLYTVPIFVAAKSQHNISSLHQVKYFLDTLGINPVVVSAGRCPAQSDTVRQQWGDRGQAVPLPCPQCTPTTRAATIISVWVQKIMFLRNINIILSSEIDICACFIF